MTTIYVLHEFYSEDGGICKILSLHLTFDGAYQALMNESETLANDFDDDESLLEEITDEQKLVDGVFFKGFVYKEGYNKMLKKSIYFRRDYSDWACDIFVRDTSEGTYSRIIAEGDSETHFVITAKYVQE